MKQIFILMLMINFISTVYCQNFKYIKPKLTDSTKVIKTEIDKENEFERIYYIDYAINSSARKELMEFDRSSYESIKLTYWGILRNLQSKPKKVNSNLPEKWVKVFKYKGEWVLFNDLPKFLLTDSCLITFDMDDPTSDIITNYKSTYNKYIFNLQSYNWEDPGVNSKSFLEIKVLDSKRLITLWKFFYNEQKSFYLMAPKDQVSNFPIMVMRETDLMDDENEIFDKIDYEKLWENEYY